MSLRRPRGVTARCRAANTRSTMRATSGHADRRGDDAGEAVARLVGDDLAETAVGADEGAQRNRRDDVDGRRPDAAEQQRQRERQLGAEEDVALAQAHAARRVDDVAVHPVDRGVGVGQDRRDGQHDERQQERPAAEAQRGDRDRDHREAGQRATDVGDVDGRERAAVDVAEPDAQRHADGDRDEEGDRRDPQLLDGLVEQQRRVVADEREGVEDVVHASRLREAHGVASRWTRTSNASARSARAMARKPAA